jgi:hypothetical protein
MNEREISFMTAVPEREILNSLATGHFPGATFTDGKWSVPAQSVIGWTKAHQLKGYHINPPAWVEACIDRFGYR